MSTLTKIDLVETLSSGLDMSKPEAKLLVEHFFTTLHSSLTTGHHVRLSGFGNFCLRDKKQRPGRNPKTGEPVAISARRVVTFRPGYKLRSLVETIKPDDGQAYHDDAILPPDFE